MLPSESILQCPVGEGGLSFAGEEDLQELNRRIEKGELRHLSGEPAKIQMEAALVSSDGQFIYPVVDEILILLPCLAIAATERISDDIRQPLTPETERVMRFYDEIGWQSGSEGGFQDADLFEDLRPVSAEYIHRCHLRVNQGLVSHGDYLLDVASGPVQYNDYLSYSEGYGRRICADISIAALKAAKAKLGEKGIYIQCDITQLPLKNGSVDGFVSLHTIYHVPAGKQETAFRELERVLKNGGSGAVVYSWGTNCLAMRLLTSQFHPIRILKQIIKKALPAALTGWLKKISKGRAPSVLATTGLSDGMTKPKPALYFRPHDYTWFQSTINTRGGWDIRPWRSVSVSFLKRYAHGRFGGRVALRALFSLENTFPALFGRIGQYPLMVYRKSRPNNPDAGDS